jgi:ABC-type uncharacterized transport system involved in gliding motility auxiliary subunit
MAINLVAWIAKPGDLQPRSRRKLEHCTGWKAQEVNSLSEDIFAELSGVDCKPFQTQLVKQLCMNQMHLTQIWLAGIFRYSAAVFYRSTAMRVAFNALSRD